MEPRAVAGILDSGRTMENAGHAAAIIAGLGCFLAHPAAARIAFAGAILLWIGECWLAARTRIDASLFRMLAENLTEDPEARVDRLDRLLMRWGLVKNARERSMDHRCRGALRLWRVQVAAFAIECCALAAGLIFALASGTV